MATKSTAARKTLAQVHPASTSRIERASIELTGPPEAPKSDEVIDALKFALEKYGVRPLIKALEEHKQELSDRLLAMVRREGETMIVKGEEKVTYETDLHTFRVIKGRNVYIGEKDLRLTMTACSITPKVQDKILTCKQVTPYEYVGVYKKGEREPGAGK